MKVGRIAAVIFRVLLVLVVTVCVSVKHAAANVSGSVYGADDDALSVDKREMSRGYKNFVSVMGGGKGTCRGFPCIHSQLGSKVGMETMYRDFVGELVRSCMGDPHCSPGRRRR